MNCFRLIAIIGICLPGLTLTGKAQSVMFTTLAGNAGYGSADGSNTVARFNAPDGIAVGVSHNVYVADTGNSTIRRITPDGFVLTIAGLAGSAGAQNGFGSNARFSQPQSVVVDTNENIYVADTANSVIRMVEPSGQVTTLAGSPGSIGAANGTNSVARFNLPAAIAIDRSGVLYVADTFNSTIRRLELSGTNCIVTTLAGSNGVAGNVDSTNTASLFNMPRGIAVDNGGALYVSDTGNNSIRRIALTGGNWVAKTIAHVNSPRSIAVDDSGNLYVANATENIVQKIALTGTNWVITAFAGASGIAGSVDGTNALLNFPCGVAVDSDGSICVADSLNNTIRKITDSGFVSTFAGQAGGSGTADGVQQLARFYGPKGIALDAARNIYVADSLNNRIRRVTSAGVVTTLAGIATGLPGANDGFGTNASFNAPAALVVDALTNVYIADLSNNEIRKLSPSGTNWNVTTVAGRAGSVHYGPITNVVNGISNVVAGVTNISIIYSISSNYRNYSGYSTNIGGGVTNVSVVITNFPYLMFTNPANGKVLTNWLATNSFILPLAPQRLDGVGTNALFHRPSGLALDAVGNLYVADGGTNGLRVIDPNGTVSTITGFYAGGTNLLRPSSVATDVNGKIYVADSFNNVVARIDPGGSFVVLAGWPGTYGTNDGVNFGARFASPNALAIDGQTNLFVTDSLSHTIRKIAPNGSDWIVTTIGGRAGVSGSEDGLDTAARFDNPGGVAVDDSGNLYIADTDNNTLRFGQPISETGPNAVMLQISVADSQVIISWPATAVGFGLEVRHDWATDVWSPVVGQPFASGTNLVFTNQAAGPAAFYRLRKP